MRKQKPNIFLLTRDNYYFILEKKYLMKSRFFKNIFESDTGAGYLRKPIYLQKIKSIYFKFVIKYLKQYEKVEDNWKTIDVITICNLYNIYNQWDKKFIREVKRTFENDLESFEEFLMIVRYLCIDNLYEKIKYCYDYLKNMRDYKLDEDEYSD